MSGNLSLVARNYLLGRSSRREEYRRELSLNNPLAITHLLKESVQILKEFNPLPNMRDLSENQVNGVMNRNMWIRYVAKPAIKDTFVVVQSGGDSASDALVRGLYETDPLVKVFSGLVLLEFDNISYRLAEQLTRAYLHINEADREMPYYRNSGQFMMFLIVLYKGGDPRWKEVMNGILQKDGINYAELKSRVTNTIFEYLFPETGY